MKKFLFLALVSLTIGVAASAQSQRQGALSPRFDTTGQGDNTGRVLTYNFRTVFSSAATDTIKIYPNAYETIIRDSLISVADSNSIAIASSPLGTISAQVGDVIKIIIQGPSGGVVTLFNSGLRNLVISQGRIVLGSSGVANVSLTFNGYLFVESGRVTH